MRWPAPTRAWFFDLVITVTGLGLAVTASWFQPNSVGTTVTGPLWLRVVFPLGLALPLMSRHRAPVLAYATTMAVLVCQGLVTDNSPEGLQIIFCVGVGTYSVGAHPDRRHAWWGLCLGLVGFAIYGATNADIRTGESGQLWSGAFFAVALVSAWLAGVYVAARREAQEAVARRTQLEADTRRAIAEERSKLARELHDVVAHNLSVVVVQAAGARARGGHSAEALEKIERSGRESLIEMRRLLGVLRGDDDSAGLQPQPGINDIAELVRRVRAAGLPVALEIRGTGSSTGDRDQPAEVLAGEINALSVALQLSAYRIVQESLTNVLKHAAPAHAEVTVAIQPGAVLIDVEDDGTVESSAPDGGSGIVGMRHEWRSSMGCSRLDRVRTADSRYTPSFLEGVADDPDRARR